MTPCPNDQLLLRLQVPGPGTAAALRLLERELRAVERGAGTQAAYNCVLRAQAALGLRRPTLAIYDHAFQFIGGAQKYGLTMAAALRDMFEITVLANKPVRLEDFEDWYGLDLRGSTVRVLPLPYYEERGDFHLDPAFIDRKVENPFHLVSRASGDYDVFVNNSMNEMVLPLSNLSVLVCHFPERRRRSYFYADRYTSTIANSLYTAGWIEARWKYRPQVQIYPPVDVGAAGVPAAKKKIILSVARFEPEGTKRQREMAGAFLKLKRDWPEVVSGWTLVLAGGSPPGNRYLAGLERLTGGGRPGGPVELRVNIPLPELKALYGEASLFWHVCGLTHDDPSEIEHFGMTTVEAMQNRVVPLVYDGGGLREIVDQGLNGFRVRTTGQLLEATIRLLKDPALLNRLGEAAAAKAGAYSRARFEERVRDFFGALLGDYSSGLLQKDRLRL